MTRSKALPARPSLDSLRKQAKKLTRDVAAGDADSIARAQVHLPRIDGPLTQRNALLVIAREYGFAGWADLTAEVQARLGRGLEWAVAQARRVIHDNNVDALRQLLTDYPALLMWSDEGGLLGMATASYGDSADPVSEAHFTRAACAALLIDAGAVVEPAVCDDLLRSRAKGMLRLFQRKGVLPGTLPFTAALDDVGAVHRVLDERPHDVAALGDAFAVSCDFDNEPVALELLARAIDLDPQLGSRVEGIGRLPFVRFFVENRPSRARDVGLWRAFVMEQIRRAVNSWSGHSPSVAEPAGESDLTTFVELLHREGWLLDEAFVDYQAELIERATLKNAVAFITALYDLEPAILRCELPPKAQAIEFAFTYARSHLVPLLTRVWPLPDDLPHAAGLGDLPRVTRWFDASGAPLLGDIDRHYPCAPYMPQDRLDEYARQWGPHRVQRVLDVALAWSVINSHFEVATFLLAHGADINTTWSSHEPASILHELVFHANYPAMQFLIDRGIDMTIRDYRWNATAQGWAEHAAKDAAMAEWLAGAERARGRR